MILSKSRGAVAKTHIQFFETSFCAADLKPAFDARFDELMVSRIRINWTLDGEFVTFLTIRKRND